jgi:hypothetical protein
MNNNQKEKGHFEVVGMISAKSTGSVWKISLIR